MPNERSAEAFLKPRSANEFLEPRSAQAFLKPRSASEFLSEKPEPKAQEIPTIGESLGTTLPITQLADPRAAIGVSETVAQLGTGIVSSALAVPVATFAAIRDNDINEFPKVFNEMVERFTFQPRTETGKRISDIVASPFILAEALGEHFSQKIADQPIEEEVETIGGLLEEDDDEDFTEEDKALGVASVKTIITAIPFALGAILGRRGRTKQITQEALPDIEIQHRAIGADANIKPTSTMNEATARVLSNTKQTVADVIDIVGGKAITPIRNIKSPTAEKLANIMEPSEVPTKPVKAGFFERVSRENGRFITRVQDAFDLVSTKGPFAKIPKNLKLDIVRGLRGEKIEGKAKQTVKELREVLNDHIKYQRGAGVEVGFLDDFFPRVYNKRLLQRDSSGLEKVLHKEGIDATTANEIAIKIINEDGILDFGREKVRPDLTNESDFRASSRVLSQKKPIKTSSEFARKLKDIPDKVLEPFLENDPYTVINAYIERGVRRAEYVRSFGKDEGKLNSMVKDIIKESNQLGEPVRFKDIQRIYDLADALQQNFKPIQSRSIKRANNFLTTYQYLRTLPLATISSLSEPFLILERGRLKSTLKAVPKILGDSVRQIARTAYKGIEKGEATKAAEQAGLALDTALSERVAAIAGGGEALGRVSGAVTDAFFKATLLTQFTRFNRVFGFQAGKNMIIDNLRDISKRPDKLNRGDKIKVRKLVELGIDPVEGIKWIQEGALKESPFYENVITGATRFTNEVVMSPRPTNRPLWQSDPHFRLVAQLKGFQTVFGNTVMKRWFREIFKRGKLEGTQNAAKIAAVGTLMTVVAMLGNELREFVKFGPKGNPRFKNEKPEVTVIRALERAGFAGSFQFAQDALFAHRFGSPAIEALAGPQASQIGKLIPSIGKAIEGQKGPLINVGVSAIPGVNIIPSVRKKLRESLKK